MVWSFPNGLRSSLCRAPPQGRWVCRSLCISLSPSTSSVTRLVCFTHNCIAASLLLCTQLWPAHAAVVRTNFVARAYNQSLQFTVHSKWNGRGDSLHPINCRFSGNTFNKLWSRKYKFSWKPLQRFFLNYRYCKIDTRNYGEQLEWKILKPSKMQVWN